MIDVARKSCPEPGVYHRIPFADYRDWDAMNLSTLLEGMVSMEHLKAALDGQLRKTSSALEFGKAFHARILEPEVYADEWRVARQCEAIIDRGKPKERRCQNQGNKLFDGVWFCGTHCKSESEAEQFVSEADAKRIEDIAEKVKTHPVIKMLRAHGGHETSVVWNYRGVTFKSRYDKYIQGGRCPDTIVDLKKVSVRRGGFDAFGRSIIDYHYHIRAAAYMLAAELLTGTRPKFIWVVIEDTYPYSIGVYELSTHDFEIGRFHFERLIDGYKQGLATDTWPGYSQDIREAQLPGWYVKVWSQALEYADNPN